MIKYTPPSVDNLVNNLPDVLKQARQFLSWVPRGEKKIPVTRDGKPVDCNDPNAWMIFPEVIELRERGKTFGIGLALPSRRDAGRLHDFKLIPDLIALDCDAKRSPLAAPNKVPEKIRTIVRRVDSYSEFSTSLKGLRSLLFGTMLTEKQHITKSLGDGMEIGLYRAGWVTLSGLTIAECSPAIEHRQGILDQIVAELWPAAGIEPKVCCAQTLVADTENFVLDWSRAASLKNIREFLQGVCRTTEQVENLRGAWELKRGWDHGASPDASMYTKRIVEEALWVRPYVGWTLQDVVDIVITYCKKNSLRWPAGRARKQVADGQAYTLRNTSRPDLYGLNEQRVVIDPSKQPTQTLTGIGVQIIDGDARTAAGNLSGSTLNDLPADPPLRPWDTSDCASAPTRLAKVSQEFKHKSRSRDLVFHAINDYRGWVKPRTLAAKTGMTEGAVKQQLKRLRRLELVIGDGRGRYRRRRERKPRRLKPCTAKPFPKSRKGTERKTLTRSQLKKRGWCKAMIDKLLPVARTDYIERDIENSYTLRLHRTRLYWVSRIKFIERQPSFEVERATIFHQQRTSTRRSRKEGGDEQQIKA